MYRVKTTPYFENLYSKIQALGGIFNAHVHIDRAGTYDETLKILTELKDHDASHLSLSVKHSIIPRIHQSICYQPEILERRTQHYIDMLIDIGTTRVDTVVDVTDDNVGCEALDCLRALQQKNSDKIDFRVGAYSPFGFRDDEPKRWELIKRAAESADFIGSLPERDDPSRSAGHIGFDESCRRALLLAAKLDKPLHIHVDQQNHAFESGTERVIRIMRELGLDKVKRREPLVWLIHVISPSTYDETRFARLIEEMVECNAGVICCPSAAISMRQYRSLNSPTHNSIARALEMLAAGIHVRLGSDNICDITSPAGTIDLMDEIFVFCNAVRFYDLDILAKLGAGVALNSQDMNMIKAHLVADAEEAANSVSRFKAGMM